ncbi:hypothetical protein RRG08_014659 [Elysia crispata]|uniref:Uncharacterized protein n=1 Tax=Elysia crispata TaxID=231223 RepID=A0AAE0YHM5_9GAST|nr:hypothetical protein RRG08_014659 [Elysia crispata]
MITASCVADTFHVRTTRSDTPVLHAGLTAGVTCRKGGGGACLFSVRVNNAICVPGEIEVSFNLLVTLWSTQGQRVWGSNLRASEARPSFLFIESCLRVGGDGRDLLHPDWTDMDWLIRRLHNDSDVVRSSKDEKLYKISSDRSPKQASSCFPREITLKMASECDAY